LDYYIFIYLTGLEFAMENPNQCSLYPGQDMTNRRLCPRNINSVNTEPNFLVRCHL